MTAGDRSICRLILIQDEDRVKLPSYRQTGAWLVNPRRSRRLWTGFTASVDHPACGGGRRIVRRWIPEE